MKTTSNKKLANLIRSDAQRFAALKHELAGLDYFRNAGVIQW